MDIELPAVIVANSNEMNFEEKELTKADSLKIIRICAIDSFDTIIGKALLISLFTCTLFSLLIESYHIFYLLDDLEFFKHAPLYFGQIYFLITLCFVFYFVQVIYKLHDRYHQWQPNVDATILNQKIAKQSPRLTTFALFLIIITVSGGVLFAIPTERDSEIYLTITWLENNAPGSMRYFISLSLRMTFVLFSPIFQIPYIQISYIVQHQKFQIDFFLQHLKNINTDYEDLDEEELIYNQKYHENMAQRLLFCVKRHVEFLNLGQKMCKQSELLLFIFTVIGCLFVISILMFTLEVRDMPLLMYARMIYCALAIAISGVALVQQGQKVEDAYHDIFLALCDTEWYHWNQETKKVYLKILTAALRQMRIKYSENMSLNYEFGAGVIKTVYSVCCVMHHSK